MVKYPYNLEMWCEPEAVPNEDGSWAEGQGRWRYLGRCNLRQNGNTNEVALTDGNVIIPTFEVIMPSYIDAIPIGTKVRVSKNGVSITCCCNGISEEYRVRGYKPYKQRFASRILWL